MAGYNVIAGLVLCLGLMWAAARDSWWTRA
jgi:hypothetical protein